MGTAATKDEFVPSASQANDSVGGRALVGGVWTATAQLSPYVYTTLVSIVAARILGPDDMGRQSFISFVVIAGQAVCTSGLGYALVRYVGELIGQGRQEVVRSLAWFGWRVAAPVSLLAAFPLVLVAVLGAEPRAAWIFGAVGVLAGGLSNIPARVLIGGQRWRPQALVSLVTGGPAAAATIAVLFLGLGITGMMAVAAVSALWMLGWSTLLMFRFLREISTSSIPLGDLRRDVVRFALASSVPVLLTFVVLQRSEFFFLNRYSSDAQIAIYSIAFSTLLALLALPMVVRMIVIPSVASMVGAGQFDRIHRGFSRLVRLSILLTFPLTAGALALGPALLRLVYGEQYSGAGEILLILVAPLPLVPLSAAASALLMGYGRVRTPTVASGFAAAVDIAAAAVLVPRFDAVGAALANVLAAVAVTISMIPECYRLVGGIDVSLRHVLRLTIASAAAAGLAHLVLEVAGGGEVFVAALLVGIGSFAALAILLKVMPEEDAEWLATVGRKRHAGRVARAARLLAS